MQSLRSIGIRVFFSVTEKGECDPNVLYIHDIKRFYSVYANRLKTLVRIKLLKQIIYLQCQIKRKAEIINLVHDLDHASPIHAVCGNTKKTSRNRY